MYGFVQIFFPCVRILYAFFLLVDIRPLFSVLLLPKVPIVLTNALNKNCIELNFLQKTQWVYGFISSRSGASVHQRFVNFEILYWNRKVCLLYGWTLPKVPIRLKNVLIKSCLKLYFLQKPHWESVRTRKIRKSGNTYWAYRM